MAAAADGRRFAAIRRLIELWALGGGLLLVAVALTNVASVVGAALFTANETGWLGGILPDWLARPVPGDFELTEMGTCIAAFAFLPYVQLTRSNVTADIFTSGASPRWVARFSLAGSVVAILFTLILGWRMYFGMLDQQAYGYTTAILAIPHWIAFVPILISLALTTVAAAITLAEDAARA
ncbi:MAG: hypothetical protein KatS3mg118_1664 [Paracoccaceae bacterium]|nr:MAG: TRAP transporter small permease [Alphaproteobacteria bacterium]GIX13705.1 MAG: hypothetical protein KatS3mg118_1664 [Paracoccaceae bacterium]